MRRYLQKKIKMLQYLTAHKLNGNLLMKNEINLNTLIIIDQVIYCMRQYTYTNDEHVVLLYCYALNLFHLIEMCAYK